MNWNVLVGSAALTALSFCGGAAAQSLQLSFPVDCRLGQTCEIQNYVDADPAAGAAKDYRGGSLSYDAHNGTDIRVPTLAAQRAGVAVLAAADGKVLRGRDGVPDRSVREPGQAGAVESRECGNGVVIGHEGGYETQYCHLAMGSLRVKPGDTVKAGQPIGRIGLSGQTEYPHLHFTVRKGTTVVDPFTPGLWRSPPAYRPRAVLNTGFHSAPVDFAFIEAGQGARPAADAPALVAYARAIGLRAGDVQEITLKGPKGEVLATNRAQPLPRNQAQNMLFVGKKRPAQGWAKGAYTGSYRVLRDGQVVLQQEFRTGL
jgi:hypothetical protein